MIKARGTVNGKDTLIIGLSYSNLDRLRADAGNVFIQIDGAEVNLPIDVVILSGKDESAMLDILAPGLNAATKVDIDPKFRS